MAGFVIAVAAMAIVPDAAPLQIALTRRTTFGVVRQGLAPEVHVLRSIRDASFALALVTFALPVVAVECPPGIRFQYDDFATPDGLAFNGDAGARRNRLRLAGPRGWTRGSAFLRESIALDARTSFSTHARFRIRGSRGRGSGGLAFVLQGVGSGALGGGGNGMGFGRLTPSVVVELDVARGITDADANHVGINRNGSWASLVTARPGFKL